MDYYYKLIDTAPYEDIVEEILKLMQDDNISSLETLSLFLEKKIDDTQLKMELPVLVCKAFLQKGTFGVAKLVEILFSIEGSIYRQAIIRSIWLASQGELDRFFCKSLNYHYFEKPLDGETIAAAGEAFRDYVLNSLENEQSFSTFAFFLYQQSLYTLGRDGYNNLMRAVTSIISDSTIKITKQLLLKFESLINENKLEEEYQRFLEDNPVFIDPLASQIVNKHKLGDDLITDFVVKNLRNEYMLVEIEKPSNKIFTSKLDFTSAFIHAYGQVLDFISWINNNVSYAQTKLPNINDPKGLVIIGRASDLNETGIKKLKTFNDSNPRIKVLTYDDILLNANNLFDNIKNPNK